MGAEPQRRADIVRATWLGHSTVVIDLGATRVITDPLLRPHAGVLRRRGVGPRPDAWEGADAVLLSHLHHDHAELRSLRELGEVPVLTVPANAAWLMRRGLHGVPLDDDWTAVGTNGVVVRPVKAVHHSRPMPHRPNAVCGHLLRDRATTVWFAGDTSLYDEMADLPQLAGAERIDLALVPIAGWGPRLSDGHMGPEEAAHACRVTRARTAVPIHWGTLHPPFLDRVRPGWMDRPAELFGEALARIAPETSLVLLSPGEAFVGP